MTVLVTGATGCIGYALAARLVASGDYNEVRALVRPGHASPDVAFGVRVVSGGLDDKNALQIAAKNVDVVFHCAAKVHAANGDPADFFRVNVAGTQNLLDACASENAAPPRFVFFSTVAVYGDDTPPGGLTEDAPPRPQTPYAQSKADTEGIVAAWSQTNRACVYNLRIATVYGPRDRGNLGRMMKALSRNRYVRIGDGRNRKTCANVENVAHAAIAMSRQDAFCDGTPVNVADYAPYTLRELEAAMQTALFEMSGQNRPPSRRLLALPVPVALALSAGVTRLAKVARRKSPLAPAQVQRLASDNVYRVERLGTLTGYFPSGSLSQGMSAAANDLLYRGSKIGEAETRKGRTDCGEARL